MSYPTEVQAIIDLTLDLLSDDSQFDRDLLTELRQLSAIGQWSSKGALSNAVDDLLVQGEQADG